MMKKKVPEWLNSSLWSAAPSADSDDRVLRNAFRPSNAAIVAPSEPVHPPTEPPIPVHPPSAIKPQKKEEHEREPRDSRSFDDQQNGISSENTNTTTNSPEDVSRQAQLLTEVRVFSLCLFVHLMRIYDVELEISFVLCSCRKR